MLKNPLLDQYAPITSEIGFIECNAKTASGAFMEWQQSIQTARNVRLDIQELVGDMPMKIESLLPLTSVEARRFLFLPTRSDWTAYLDNGWEGTDAFSVVSYLSRTIHRRGIRTVCVPHSMRKTPAGEIGRYGATMLECYAADSIGCSFLNIQRSISTVCDGGRWQFDANGEPMDFERLEQYRARQIRDRFTAEMLQEYLIAIGIDVFSEGFYDTNEVSYIVSKEGPSAENMKEYTLDEARALY